MFLTHANVITNGIFGFSLYSKDRNSPVWICSRQNIRFFHLLSVILKTDLLSEAVTGRINFWDKSTAFAVTASQ